MTTDRIQTLANLLNDCRTVRTGLALLAWGVALTVEGCTEKEREEMLVALVATANIHLERMDMFRAAVPTARLQ